MSPQNPSHSSLRFGEFSADLEERELYRDEARVRLQGQPFEVLLVLLERPVHVVTREELKRRLWPADTFVDFQHGLNVAINRLREALGDSAEQPRFIETVPRRGYKFIAPVEGVLESGASPVAVKTAEVPRSRVLPLTGIVLLLALGVSVVTWWLWPARPPRVTGTTRLSFSGKAGIFSADLATGLELAAPVLAADGSRVYFSSPKGGMGAVRRLAYISVAGGDEQFMTAPFDTVNLRDISPDGSSLLVYGVVAGDLPSGAHLWVVPADGGGPRRLGDVDGEDGAWSPDGHQITYVKDQDLYVADKNGGNTKKLISAPGKPFWIRWSPDAGRIRFTVRDPTTNRHRLWECHSDGSDLHRLSFVPTKTAEECCGEWTPDGRYFLFTVLEDNHADLWVASESRFGRRLYKATRLTTGPLDFLAAIPSRNGKKVFAIGVQTRYELRKYNFKTRENTPYLPGTSAHAVSSSADGRWVAYVEEHGRGAALWRSTSDGRERLQLTQPPMMVGFSQWARDGKQIAFMGRKPEKPWNIYVVPSSGGNVAVVSPEEHNFVDAEWSPDGHSLLFGRTPDYMGEPGSPKAISILNLDTHQITTLPGSEGFYSPRWSPNGRYVVAVPLSEEKLVLFDFATQTWTDLTPGRLHMGNPRWSPDSEYVYVDVHPEHALLRIGMHDRKLEKVLDLNTLSPNAAECDFDNIGWDARAVVACWLESGDIYALDLDLP
jgi:Tol biopolymer transport system component/DNA-binding winged helix-turn-helix (wHTH) protein